MKAPKKLPSPAFDLSLSRGGWQPQDLGRRPAQLHEGEESLGPYFLRSLRVSTWRIIVSQVISTLIGVIGIVALIITLVTKSHDALSKHLKVPGLQATRFRVQGLPYKRLGFLFPANLDTSRGLESQEDLNHPPKPSKTP